MSTLDLFGKGYVLLQGPTSTLPAQQVLGAAATRTKAYKVGTDFSFCDENVTWSTLTAQAGQEDILVRPDGFVAYGLQTS